MTPLDLHTSWPQHDDIRLPPRCFVVFTLERPSLPFCLRYIATSFQATSASPTQTMATEPRSNTKPGRYSYTFSQQSLHRAPRPTSPSMVSTMLEVHSQWPSLSSLPDVQPPSHSQTQHTTTVRTTSIGQASAAPTLHIPPTSPIWTARAVPIPSSALSYLFWTVHPPLVDAELKCPPALPTPNTNRVEMRQPSPVLSAQPPATPQTPARDDVLAAKRQLGMFNTLTTASLPGSLKTPSQNGPRGFRTPPTAPRAMREGRLQTCECLTKSKFANVSCARHHCPGRDAVRTGSNRGSCREQDPERREA